MTSVPADFGREYPKGVKGRPAATSGTSAPGPGMPRGRVWARRLGLFLLWGLVGGIFLVAAGLWWACRGDACPDVRYLETFQAQQSSKVYDVKGRLIGEFGTQRRTVVPLDSIPKVVQRAFLAVEDKRFYQHHGVDWVRIGGAMARNIRAGGYAQGFSTVSMQLARNIFPERLTREKTIVRKLREIRVAWAIESRYSKAKILQLYLNQIYLGAGAYGVEAASQRYFGRSARTLSLDEAALLAGLPKAPEYYNPRKYPDRALGRRDVVLRLMEQDGAAQPRDVQRALRRPIWTTAQVEEEKNTRAIVVGKIAPYFIEAVRRELEDRFGNALYHAGYRIHSTLDADMQNDAERAVESQARALESGTYGAWKHPKMGSRKTAEGGAGSPYLQAAFIAIDPSDGSVRALIGGRDFQDSKFNRATQALRQPGSTFKPFVYATALANGWTPESMVNDQPVMLAGRAGGVWAPQNYDREFEGPVTLRRALMLSRNVPAVRLGISVGLDKVIATAHQAGIRTPIPRYVPIVLGAADVVPMELVSAYGTIASLGQRTTPHVVQHVEDAFGRLVWAPTLRKEVVMSPAVAFALVDMMRDVIARGTAYASVWEAGFRDPAAGKTGTTNDGTDVWFIGMTPRLVAGIWMGFDSTLR